MGWFDNLLRDEATPRRRWEPGDEVVAARDCDYGPEGARVQQGTCGSVLAHGHGVFGDDVTVQFDTGHTATVTPMALKHRRRTDTSPGSHA